MGLQAKPDVSVLVPTRDRCDLLGRLLDAIACQTVTQGRVEVVVADDGSGDAAAAVVERFPFSPAASPQVAGAGRPEPATSP